MKFYHYSQNNSGGQFTGGMPHDLIIEAESAEDANRRAEDAGAYFDGVGDGQDCECCGDRWYPASDYAVPDTEPCIYGKPVLETLASGELSFYRGYVRIVYANGAKIDINHVKE
jgi:hypothetical protein